MEYYEAVNTRGSLYDNINVDLGITKYMLDIEVDVSPIIMNMKQILASDILERVDYTYYTDIYNVVVLSIIKAVTRGIVAVGVYEYTATLKALLPIAKLYIETDATRLNIAHLLNTTLFDEPSILDRLISEIYGKFLTKLYIYLPQGEYVGELPALFDTFILSNSYVMHGITRNKTISIMRYEG